MKTEFRDGFTKDLKEISEKAILNRIRTAIELIEKVTTLEGVPQVKKLKGGGNFYRIRVGDYRIGIALDQDTVVFVRCLNRKDIYKFFP